MAIVGKKKTGIYPTISPSTMGYRGTGADGSPGCSNKAALQTAYKGSPLVGYTTPAKYAVGGEGGVEPTVDQKMDMTSEKTLKKWFFLNVVNGTVDNTNLGLTGFSLEYALAPNLNTVDTGKANEPATPFVPNPNSPGDAWSNLGGQPAVGKASDSSFVKSLDDDGQSQLAGSSIKVNAKLADSAVKNVAAILPTDVTLPVEAEDPAP